MQTVHIRVLILAMEGSIRGPTGACGCLCSALTRLDLPGQADLVKIDAEGAEAEALEGRGGCWSMTVRRWWWRCIRWGARQGYANAGRVAPYSGCGASPIPCRAGCVVVATFLDCGETGRDGRVSDGGDKIRQGGAGDVGAGRVAAGGGDVVGG